MKKRIIISIIVLIGLLTTIVSYKYVDKETPEVKNELIGVYVSGEKTDKIPSSNEGYILEKYECNDETKIEWDYSTWSVILKDFKKGSSCDYYFVKGKQVTIKIYDEEGNPIPIKGNNGETTTGATGTKVKDIKVPEIEGYEFEGWEDKEGNKIDPNSEIDDTEDIKAKYKANEYDLTIILNSTSSTSTPNKIKYRGSVELSITPAGNDYYLSEARCSDGYTTSAKVGEDKTGTQDITITNIGVTKSGECTFTSTKKSTPDEPTPSKIKISFDSNGGSTVSDVYERTTEERYGTLPETTKTGYTFEGWYTDTTGGNKITSETMVTNTQNHTLYAHWSVNSYGLRLEKGEYISSISASSGITCGAGIVVNCTVPFGTSVTITSVPDENTEGWSINEPASASNVGQTREYKVYTYSVDSFSSSSSLSGTRNGNSYTFTMPANDLIVTANGKLSTQITQTQTSTLVKSKYNPIYVNLKSKWEEKGTVNEFIEIWDWGYENVKDLTTRTYSLCDEDYCYAYWYRREKADEQITYQIWAYSDESRDESSLLCTNKATNFMPQVECKIPYKNTYEWK